ncbi:MAG: hypothetical protein DDG60_15070 [Anaerolineae bacterium]|nr:MAG: hypothetical protein DDG60_15070 [Anaerolineae bacterium]
MRKLFAISLILLTGILLVACNGQNAPVLPPPELPTWTPTATPLPPSPTATLAPTITPTPPLNSPNGPPLLSIHMFTAMRGWGVMENQLLATNDGGFTWASVPVPGGQFDGRNGKFFISEREAFVLVAASDGSNTGTLNYTADGGQTWQSIPVPMSNGTVQFLPNTNLEGFIVQTLGGSADGMPVAVYQSLNRVDWLRTFAHVRPEEIEGLPFRGIKNGAVFINPSVGYITGSEPIDNSIYLFRTGDAGRSWQRLSLPLPEGIGTFQAETLPPVFFRDGKGFLPVDFFTEGQQTRVFYYTEDGGVSWLLRGSVPRGTVYTFVNANTGWTWAGRTLFYTTDGAATWMALPVSFLAQEVGTWLNFIDPRNGWLITVDDRSRVRLYRTTDAGSTWSVVIP